MAAKPLLEESAGGNAAHIVSELSESGMAHEAIKSWKKAFTAAIYRASLRFMALQQASNCATNSTT